MVGFVPLSSKKREGMGRFAGHAYAQWGCVGRAWLLQGGREGSVHSRHKSREMESRSASDTGRARSKTESWSFTLPTASSPLVESGQVTGGLRMESSPR